MDKQEKMFLLVDQWRKSGMTRKAFAQEYGVTDSSLEYWCRKRDNKLGKRTAAAGEFVEIIPNQDSESDVAKNKNTIMVELELPSGIKLKIY
ncbi:IS66 family insertion sequence element accessory protein TnpA [Saccharicrinis sp. 156]|uniref:IS66 family insertion sequence element accessory protein TnpA n=1 Tax=Saccharicrinis sp. 156 TaxID=3417574 RepID=UPI003D3315CC